MPSYLYKCLCEEENYNHGEFEVNHSINDKLIECPKCKEEGRDSKVERLIAGGSNFVLLGGGWFSEGYHK